MSDVHHYLAFDFGASSGRAVLGAFDGRRVTLSEVHRFDNGPLACGDRLHWDLDALFDHVRKALCRVGLSGIVLNGVGIDTWGVDYGLLSAEDQLLVLPHHYRDPRTAGVMERAFRTVSRDTIYARTGIQFMSLNTLYQLLADRDAGDARLDRAATLLFMPDLLNWRLTGVKRTDVTIASTSQCFDPIARRWAVNLLAELDLPSHFLPDVGEPATPIGSLRRELADETGIGPVRILCPAGHDTACAVAAIPAEGNDWAYISCGTWSLVGVELREPILSKDALAAGVTNEIGVEGTIRFLRNVAGLWIVQECRRVWAEAGRSFSHDELTRLAERAPPRRAFIDPDDPRFTCFGDMPRRVCDFCRDSGQNVPRTEGEVVRCVLESLAMKYRWTLEHIAQLTGRPIRCVHLVGGGALNESLCQWTADACNLSVRAGPVEATALGNVLLQAMGDGRIRSLSDLRRTAGDSVAVRVYHPQDAPSWMTSQRRFESLLQG